MVSHATATAGRFGRISRGGLLVFLSLDDGGCRSWRRSGGSGGRPVGGSVDWAHDGGADAVFGLDILLADNGRLGDVAAAAVFCLFLSRRCECDTAEEESGGSKEAHDEELIGGGFSGERILLR